MADVYRAYWQDRGGRAARRAMHEFAAWAQHKHPSLAVPAAGEPAVVIPGDHDGCTVEAAVQAGSGDQGAVARAALVEDSGKERWETVLRVLEPAGQDPWLWVDVEHVTHNPFEESWVAAPRLVRSLMDHGDPYRGPTPLSTRPRLIAVDAVDPLIDALHDPARETALVVVSADPHRPVPVTIDRARGVARVLAGAVAVWVLDDGAVEAWRDRVGADMAVWGGAIRIYLPGCDPTDPEPARHRYMRPWAVAGEPGQVGLRIAAQMSRALAAQRSPAAWADLKALLLPGGVTDTDLVKLLEADNTRLETEVQRLRDSAAEHEQTRWDTAAELDAALGEVADLRARLVGATTELRRCAAGGTPPDPEVWGRIDRGVGDDPAAELSAPEEVPALVRTHLNWVALPDEACFELNRMNDRPEAQAWARRCWDGFRALDAYAAAKADGWGGGGFWEWCASGDPAAWPATTKKLAMSESETVRAGLAKTRFLPVDPAVTGAKLLGDGQVRIHMWAHLKPVEGGAGVIPRVYFHDDTAGPTRKVHVGFFGPHDLMPNTLS